MYYSGVQLIQSNLDEKELSSRISNESGTGHTIP